MGLGHFLYRSENWLNDRARIFRFMRRSESHSCLQKVQTYPGSKLPSYLLGFRIPNRFNLRLYSADISYPPSQSNQKVLQYRYIRKLNVLFINALRSILNFILSATLLCDGNRGLMNHLVQFLGNL
jgi:hypothetical protein